MERAKSIAVDEITKIAAEVSETIMMERFKDRALKPEIGLFPEVILAGIRWDPEILRMVQPEVLLEVATAVTDKLDPSLKVVPEVKLLKDVVLAGIRPIDPIITEPFKELFQ